MTKKDVYAAVLAGQESKLQEFTADLQRESGKKNCFSIARHMAREGRDVIRVCCMENDVSNIGKIRNFYRMVLVLLLFMHLLVVD